MATKGKFEPQEREYLTGLARQIDAKLVPFADAVEKAVTDLDRSAVSIKLYLGRLANRVNAQSTTGAVRRRSRRAISDLSTTVRVRRVRVLSQQYDKLKKQHESIGKKLDALSRELTDHHEALLKDLGLEKVLRHSHTED